MPAWCVPLLFASLVAVLVFAAWERPSDTSGLWMRIYSIHWLLSGGFLSLVVLLTWRWVLGEELIEWVNAAWLLAKQILPLLFLGVAAAGFLFGSPNSSEGLIPSGVVVKLVGGDGAKANLVASVAGALMYFATLTEVPIVQGLMGMGMSKGPALALLLAGPALSLPNMLVIRSVMGTKRTAAFISLVIAAATLTGLVFGSFIRP